jgi:hypothetical protein
MTDYISETNSYSVESVLHSPLTSESVLHTAQTNRRVFCIDTLEMAEQTGVNAQICTGRPMLPSSSSKLPADDMMEIEVAMSQAYESMNKSVVAQTVDFAQVQQLDQTQNKMVLDSTINALAAQKAAEAQQLSIQNDSARMADIDKYLNWGLIGVTAVLIIVTIVASVASGGAAAAALPEEVTLVSEEVTATSTAEGVGGGAATGAAGAVEASTVEAGEATVAEADGAVNAETSNALTSTAAEGGKSTTNWAAKACKIALRVTFAAAMGSPILVKAIFSLQLAPRLTDLAAAQTLVGQTMGMETRNTMYFQFLQQLIQRSGGVVSEETKDTSEVIQTYASITNAIRGISYGLANAV